MIEGRREEGVKAIINVFGAQTHTNHYYLGFYRQRETESERSRDGR